MVGLIALQSLCAVFFLADVMHDVGEGFWNIHTALEALIAVTLAASLCFGIVQLRRSLDHQKRARAAHAAASGAFAALIANRFSGWGLTPSEAEVALFALKGIDPEAIAGLRGVAPGTVRAQLTRAYAKAGVSNRGQFVSLFIEDLLADPLLPDPHKNADATAGQTGQVSALPPL